MLFIPCPFCGSRDESEFVYGGRAIRFPDMDGSTSCEEWHEIVHMRTNSIGVSPEFWYHDSGCECWIVVDREATTHTITGSRPANKVKGFPAR